MAIARRNWRNSNLAFLPAAFKAPKPTDAQLAVPFNRFRDDPTAETRRDLIEATLTIASALGMWTYRKLRRNRNGESFDPDDFRAEACLAVVNYVDAFDGDTIEAFRHGLGKFIISQVQRECRKFNKLDEHWRSWNPRKCVLIAFRKQFVIRFGRLPNKDECKAHIAELISNPHIEVKTKTFSAFDLERRPPVHLSIDDVGFELPAEARPIGTGRLNRKAVRLARRTLKPKELVIFNGILAGKTAHDIARENGWPITTAQVRVKGLLWQLRCNADLCELLGYERTELPPTRHGFRPAVSTLGPARKTG